MRFSYNQFLVSREYGGAAEIGVRLAKHLHAEQHKDVTVWIPGRGRAWQKADELSLPVRKYDAERLLSQSRWTAGLANVRLGLSLRMRWPGIAHVHDPFYYASLRRAINFSGLKSVVHVQIEHDPAGLRWAFCQPPHLIVTCATFLEEHVRQSLPAEHRERQRIVVAPNSVDIAKFQPGDKTAARRAVEAPADRPLALMLANLSPHKGQTTAIRAVGELRRRGQRIALWLAGVERDPTGHFRSELELLIRKEGVEDDVRLLGFRNDAPTLLQAADVMLLPSTNEGLPLTIVEAQACKTPVIAAPTAGVPEVIADCFTGFLVAAGDVQGYADRMADLISHPDRHRPMVEAAYKQAVSTYNWEKYRNQLCVLYQDLLTNADAPSKLA